MDTIRTFKSKQELVNTICREYADFIGFDLAKIECNERYFDTVYRYAGKVDALIEEISDVNKGKYYVICDDNITYIMPVDADKQDEQTAKSFRFIINNSEKHLCYLIDYDANAAEKINGADIFAEQADKLTA